MSLDKGILQAYLDQELSSTESIQVREHLEGCAACRLTLEELRGNTAYVAEIMSRYEKAHREMPVNTAIAWNRFTSAVPALTAPGITAATASANLMQRWIAMFKTNRKIAIAACLTIGISFSLFSQPVRSAAAQILSVFRVEKMQTISISPAELQQISKVFRENRGSLNIRNFGELQITGKSRPQQLSRVEIRARIPGAILPELLPGGYTLENVMFKSSSRIGLKLKLDNLNALLQSLGAPKLLPRELDGKTFTIQIPEVIAARFNGAPGHLLLLETKSPELITPDGVSADAIREAMLQLPFLPPELVDQLQAINDWQHTLLIPSSDGSTEAVDISGQTALYFSTVKNMAIMAQFFPAARAKMNRVEAVPDSGCVLWKSGDTIFALGGNVSKDELVSLAEEIH